MDNITTVSTHDVVCFVLETHLWSGRIQLRAEDLKKFSSTNTSLPDAALASLGSVKICDPQVTRTFEQLKREAKAVLEAAGLPLFKARAVPTHRHAEIRAKLDDIKSRFEYESKKLLATYTTKVSEWRGKWLKENPGYGHLLDRIPSAESVFGRLSFEYHDYRVEPPKGVYDDEGGSEFTTKLSGLRGELYKEAATEAITLMESCMDKAGCQREYITPKTLGPFKRIAERFRDFQNVDPSAIAAAELIEATVTQAMTFAQSEKNNRISDGALMIVLSMAQTFANPATAARLAEKSRAVGSTEVIAELLELGGVSGSTVIKTLVTATENRAEQVTSSASTPQAIVKLEPEVDIALPVDVEVNGQYVEVIAQPVKPALQVSDVDMFEASLGQPMKRRGSDAATDVLTHLVGLAKANQIEVIDVQEEKVTANTDSTPVVEEVKAKPINVGANTLTAASLQDIFSF
nr:DUF3150 domain-containing protein [Comamonas testosteroni]